MRLNGEKLFVFNFVQRKYILLQNSIVIGNYNVKTGYKQFFNCLLFLFKLYFSVQARHTVPYVCTVAQNVLIGLFTVLALKFTIYVQTSNLHLKCAIYEYAYMCKRPLKSSWFPSRPLPYEPYGTHTPPQPLPRYSHTPLIGTSGANSNQELASFNIFHVKDVSGGKIRDFLLFWKKKSRVLEI